MDPDTEYYDRENDFVFDPISMSYREIGPVF